MVIDRASIFADRFKGNPQLLQAAVLGQAPVPGLDPYTALRALQLLKEDQSMRMAQMAQQPTSSPSLVQSAMQMPQMPPQMAQGAPQQPAPQPQAAPQGMASGGLAALPSGDHDYAGGGIVAFAGPTEQNNYSLVQETPGGFPRSTTGFESLRRGMLGEDDDEGGIEDPITQEMLARGTLRSLRDARKAERVRPMTPEQEMEYRTRVYKQLQAEAGASPFDAFLAKYNITPEKAAKMDDEDLGMALLKAAGAAVQPGGTMRGLAAAASTLGETYGSAKKERRREEMATDRMRAELLDSQRKERMGMSKEASAAMERYRKERQDAARADANANRLEAQVQAQLTTAFRQPQRAAGATPKEPKVAEQLAAAEIAFENNPTEGNARNLAGLRRAMDRIRTSDIGPTRAGAALAGPKVQAEKDVAAALKTFKLVNKQYRNAEKAGDTATMNRLLAEETARLKSVFSILNPEIDDTAPPPPPGAPAAAPTRAARPAPPSGFVRDQQPS